MGFSSIFRISRGGTRVLNENPDLVLGFPLGFSTFFMKNMKNRGFSGFSGYLSSKREKRLHCAQLIFVICYRLRNAMDPGIKVGRFPYFTEFGGL